MYEKIGHRYKLEWPSMILGYVAIFVTIPIYIFYWNGPYIRERSKFAQTLAADRKKRGVIEVTCGTGQEGPECI